MRFQHVGLASFGYTLPDEIVTSQQLEDRLAPLYERLRLPAGRLELMTGIRERRFWPPDTLPSGPSIRSGEKALAAAGIALEDVGLLIHASVCRDYLEPATACKVHHALDLPADCQIFDVSNACLGVLNGIVLAANAIELGQIRAALVVATENGRPLVENTVERLNADVSLTRDRMKMAVASLTIGSASVAVVVARRDLAAGGPRLTGGVCRAETRHHELCHSGHKEAMVDGVRPWMETDSERLLHAGVGAAVPCFEQFLAELGWTRENIQKTFCHQVGVAHKRLMFEALGLDPAIDFGTVDFLGNTGAAALPVTAAIGMERGHVRPGDRVAFLGIGSGVNVTMLGWEFGV